MCFGQSARADQPTGMGYTSFGNVAGLQVGSGNFQVNYFYGSPAMADMDATPRDPAKS